MTPTTEIILIAVTTAAACALLGVPLILRRMALMSDAITHTVLFGIVVAFLFTESITSPLTILAATLSGVLTVTLVELLNRTRLVKEDAAIGLVFPALFSVAVILISRYAGDVHLDTDAVLLGELAFAPFNRFVVAGIDLGAQTLWVMGGVLLLNLSFILLFYKELKLSTFDRELAAALGFAPVLLHYAFMTIVSITAVGAFDAVGSILVVALMIAPPAAAYLLTDSLPRMFGLSVLLGAASAVGGYLLASRFDASIAGSMATMSGIIFGVCWLLAPHRGLVAQWRRHARQRWEFAQTMLTVHLLNHEDSPEAATENRISHLQEHLRWKPAFAGEVIARAEQSNFITRRDEEHLTLTAKGRAVAHAAATMTQR